MEKDRISYFMAFGIDQPLAARLAMSEAVQQQADRAKGIIKTIEWALDPGNCAATDREVADACKALEEVIEEIREWL